MKTLGILLDLQKTVSFNLPSFDDSKINYYAVEAMPIDSNNNSISTTNTSLQSPPTDTAQNIVLITSYDICKNVLTLTWNNNGFVKRNNSFTVYYSENGGETKSVKYSSTENKCIVDQNKITLTKGVQYKFQLELTHPNGIIASNILNFEVPQTSKTIPDYINIDKLDASSGSVVLHVNVDPKNELIDLLLLRTLTVISQETQKVDTIKIQLGSDEYPSFSSISITDDSELDLKNTQYKYTVSLLSCEKIVKSSPSINTLPLQDPQDREGSSEILLKWKSIGSSGQFDHYTITRYRNNESKQLPTIEDVNINNRNDDLNNLSDKQPGEFICYTITAYMKENNGVSPIIVSNQVCYQIDEMVTMPKYVVIGENNKAISDFTFPSSSYTPEKFTMRIYDRLGTKMYETTDPQKGWNGCYNNGSGSPAPAGAYIYSIEFTGSDGKVKHQQNSFIVVHK